MAAVAESAAGFGAGAGEGFGVPPPAKVAVPLSNGEGPLNVCTKKPREVPTFRELAAKVTSITSPLRKLGPMTTAFVLGAPHAEGLTPETVIQDGHA